MVLRFRQAAEIVVDSVVSTERKDVRLKRLDLASLRGSQYYPVIRFFVSELAKDEAG